jgi:predicted DNA repair protein MutK
LATGLLALLDDVISIMDDVSTMSQMAAEKTVGLAGDDLAVNAEGLVGLHPSRELPILGKVALGSLANKVVLVPLALALPSSAISPLLMIGGAFLSYEGVHKVLHAILPHDDHEVEAHQGKLHHAIRSSDPDELAKVEATKVRQAIITDIVLSAEIVAVALGAIGDVEFQVKATALSVVALGMTVGIYGLVAGLVKIDDVGLWLEQQGGSKAAIGRAMVKGTPYLMRVLSVGGTLAMFLVGGGIIAHGLELHLDHWAHELHLGWFWVEWTIGHLLPALLAAVVGLVLVGLVEGVKAVRKRVTA